MKTLPKSLETVRDKLSHEFAEANAVLDKNEFPYGWGYQEGFTAGVAAVLASAELKGLVDCLEYVESHVPNEMSKASLERWQKFLGEGSDEE